MDDNMTTDDDIERGTGTWYSPATAKSGKSVSGKFTLKVKISNGYHLKMQKKYSRSG